MADRDIAAANPPVVVLGAGPAGMTAGWRLAERGEAATVLERDTAVGDHVQAAPRR